MLHRSSCWLALMICVCGCSDKAARRVGKEAAVATLTVLDGDVQHRAGGSLSWGDAKQGVALHPRDAVKTGRKSRAVVTYRNGARLELGAQTLVIIEAPRNKAEGQAARLVARVERGTVRGVAKAGAGGIELVGRGGSRTLIQSKGDSAKVRVRALPGKPLQISTIKGSAEVASGEKTVLLGPQQGVELHKKKLGQVGQLPSYPELDSPAIDSVFATGEVTFSWKAVPRGARYHFQLAQSLDFNQAVRDDHVAQPTWKVEGLPPGRYAWRVSALNKRGWEGEYGFARRFSIVKKRRIGSLLVAPADKAGIATTKDEAVVVFRWKEKEGATGYLLLVSRSPQLKVSFKANKGRGLQTSVRLPPGSYYWNVFALDTKGKKVALAESPRELLVGKRKPPRVKVPKRIDRWR